MSHLQILPGTYNDGPHNKERYFLEIRNRYKWLLDFGGERVLLFKRKFEGERSSDFDNIRKRSRQAGQDVTASGFGTGFQGGYFKPVEVVIRIVSSTQQVVIEDIGRRQIYTPRSWTLWEPLLTNGDFVVRRNNQRLRIDNVTQHRWKHFVTRQDFDLVELEKNSPEYQVPVE